MNLEPIKIDPTDLVHPDHSDFSETDQSGRAPQCRSAGPVNSTGQLDQHDTR